MPGVEAGVAYLSGWLTPRGKARRPTPADAARRTIAPPVSGPMFSNRIEPMNLRRAPARPARPSPARPDPGRQELKKLDLKRQERQERQERAEAPPPEPGPPRPAPPGAAP